MSRSRRLSIGAAALLVTGLAAPDHAGAASATDRSPIEVTELIGPDGLPLRTVQEVNLRGQVIGGVAGNAGVLWEDRSSSFLAPAGTYMSAPADISETGQVVGIYSAAPFQLPRPFTWEDGEWTALIGPDVPFGLGFATSVNELGQVFGVQSGEPGGPIQAGVVVWEDGVPAYFADLTKVPPMWDGLAEINNRGQAIAGSESTSGAVWNIHDDNVTTLPGRGGATRVGAITELGLVAGESRGTDFTPHAVTWRDGVLQDLGTLGGAESTLGEDAGNSGFRDRHALNEWGHVVGAAQTATGDRHAFLWRNGRMTDLGTLGGATSAATAINNWGQIVGWSQTATGERHAFLWENGRMTDLGALVTGPGRSHAVDINDRGQIVGEVVEGTERRAVRWTAPPLR